MLIISHWTKIIILFFKIWQATNDIGTIKNHLLGEPIKKQIEVSTKGVLICILIFPSLFLGYTGWFF